MPHWTDMWLPSSGTKGFLQNLEMRRNGVFVVCFNTFQQEHWLSQWLWPSEKVPNQPWTKSSRFMSWSVGKMISRYSCLFNCCHHHCTIARPTHVSVQSSHLPHFPVTKKEWTMYGNRYITPMPFQGWWSAKNFTKPVWSEQETKQDWEKNLPQTLPSRCTIFLSYLLKSECHSANIWWTLKMSHIPQGNKESHFALSSEVPLWNKPLPTRADHGEWVFFPHLLWVSRRLQSTSLYLVFTDLGTQKKMMKGHTGSYSENCHYV